jgi:Ca-activated chloride channel family protein
LLPPSSLDHLPLKDTRVQIDVSGVIADVQVRQIYRNEGSRPINARYVFPASTRAAVYAMRMRIGDLR